MHCVRSRLGLLLAASFYCWAAQQSKDSAKKPIPKGTDTPESSKNLTEGKYPVDFVDLYPVAENYKQKITLKLACLHRTGSHLQPCEKDPLYPLEVGKPFALDWFSDSGLAAHISLLSGEVSPPPTSITHVFTPLKVGKIVFEADQPGLRGKFAKARPVRLMLEVRSAAPPSPDVCGPGFIPPPVGEEVPRLDAETLVSLLGDPKPFTLVPKGKEAIAIYSSHPRKTQADEAILKDLKTRIIPKFLSKRPEELGIAPPDKFAVELTIPHASALGDLTAKLDSLGYSQFTFQPVGRDRIRIKSPEVPACNEWKSFLSDVRHVVWQLNPQPSSLKLFYLNSASDVAAALAGSGASPSAGGSTPSAASGPAGNSASSPGAAASPSAGSPAAAPVPAVKLADTPTPAPAANGAAPRPSDTSRATSPAANAAKSPISMAPVGTDTVVFGDANPSDDSLIAEKRRIIASLDLPRPEMIISAWVLQNSSTDGQIVGNFNDIVQRTVSQNNEALQSGILSAWRYLKSEMDNPETYFDQVFYGYLVNRYVANLPPLTSSFSSQSGPEQYLNNRLSTYLPEKDKTGTRAQFGICGTEEYCLGYIDLFRPLQPRLTDLLLALVAAQDPWFQTWHAVCAMEHPKQSESCQDTPPVESQTTWISSAISTNVYLSRGAISTS
ncbi:MAG: hypothetical protein M3Y72_20235 [Acidobacteriota bacterium]|nr:hypothetical protein [Acidobacteriota bacterium]